MRPPFALFAPIFRSALPVGLFVLVVGASHAQAQAQTDTNTTHTSRYGIETPGQGAQDPARSEVLEGYSTDYRKCKATLIARRESDQEAGEVCTKILHDLGE